MPIALSIPMLEVEIEGISSMRRSPRRMIAPFPNAFSICESADSIAMVFSFRSIFSLAMQMLYLSIFCIGQTRLTNVQQ